MSARPIAVKQRRKVAKAFRQELPRFFDLVQWLIDNGHAKTRREARDIILAKRVKSESHTVGIHQVLAPGPTALMDALAGRQPKMEVKDEVNPRVSVDMRQNLTVASS